MTNLTANALLEGRSLPLARQPQFLYAEAKPYLNNTWLIVPTLQPNGRYSFVAFDPEGQDWSENRHPQTYKTAEAAIAVGKAYVSLRLAELAGDWEAA